MEISEVLKWLFSGAGSIAAFSWLAEQFPSWHALDSAKKKAYSFYGSASIALSAWAVLKYVPAEIIQAIGEPFAVVSGVFGLVFLGQVFHNFTK